jgi:hypothetical protein
VWRSIEAQNVPIGIESVTYSGVPYCRSASYAMVETL